MPRDLSQWEQQEAVLDDMARRIASKLLDSPQFTTLCRVQAMVLAAEQERLRREEVPRTWILTCRQKGIRVYVRDGQLFGSKPLCRDLETVKERYRQEIIDYLESEPPELGGMPLPTLEQTK